MNGTRILRWLLIILAAGVLVAGVRTAISLRPHYLGNCAMLHEFNCGYDPRFALRWSIGLGALGAAVLLVLLARTIGRHLAR